LKNCPESSNTDLIIFSDCHRNEEEKQRVNEVRAYLKKIKGFKSIQIILRKQNLGVDYNIIQGIQEMAEQFERFIVVEDDIEVSNQFLHFMNAGLNHFKCFENVITISAFNYVKILKNYPFDCYFAQRTNPWGWATWSHKIKDVDWNLALKENFLESPLLRKEFNVWGSDRSRMLRRTLKGDIRAWDIRLDYYQHRMDLLTAYSTKNLTVNNGFNSDDASNTTGYNRFKVNHQKFDKYSFLFPDFILFNETIKRRFIKRNSLLNRIITFALKNFNFNN
jgi:hypothetical protein